MQESEKLLIDIGLTPTEAKIYLAGLSSEATSVQVLAQKTRIKRPTVYHALATLASKGLATEKKVSNRSQYKMSSPEHIRGLVALQREQMESRARGLDELIPLLVQQSQANKKDGIDVVNYSGVEGMKMVMDIAFYCKSKQWDILAPFDNFLREYDKEYAQRYLRARKYYGIISRTLWEKDTRGGRKLTTEEIREREPRIMPATMHGKFRSMMILFDDKVAIFSSYEKLSAILITSKELHAMFLAMYEGLWESSEEYT